MLSAINATTAIITFPEITKAIENANVIVKDGKGNVVETKPMLLTEGTTQAEFEFVTPFPVDHKFTGVWTVNDEKYSFDAINQLADIKEAVKANNEIKLQAALDAAGITYADETRITKYLSELQKTDATASLEAVQKAITTFDEGIATEADKAAAVKAVEEATTQAQLLKALQTHFDVVNPEWIVSYDEAIDFDAELNATPKTVEGIQDAIYNTNLEKVAPKVEAANMSLDSEKVTEARTLVTNWIPAISVDEDSDFAGLKDQLLDLLSVEDALIAIDQAKTNSALKTALINLDTLENSLIEKYKVLSVLVDEFDIKTVTEANLTAYREVIKGKVVGSKNQRKDIQAIITTVNGDTTANAKIQVLADLNKVTVKTSVADVVALLEKSQVLHELTNKVNAAYAEAYRTALDAAGELDAAGVSTLIGTTNDAQDALNGLVDTKEELLAALATSAEENSTLKTITLEKSIEVDGATIKLTSGVTIEGNNHTLYVIGSGAGSSTAEGIEVTAGSKDVVIKDLKVVGTHEDNLIEIYGSATLDNVSAIGGKKAGIYVNNDAASTITVTFKDVTTASNGWDAGIGIASQQIGSKVIANFTGTNSFGEAVAVYTDDLVQYKGQYEVTGLESLEKKIVDNQTKWFTGNQVK